MNILVISPAYGYANVNAGSFIHSQAKSLSNIKGNHVRVIVMVPVSPFKIRNKKPIVKIIDGIVILFVEYPSFSNIGEKFSLNHYSAYGVLLRNTNGFLKDFSPDIIYIHTIRSETSAAARYGKNKNLPVVTAIHGSDLMIPFNNGKIDSIKKKVCLSDRIITVGPKIEAIIREIAPDTSVDLLINGAEIDNLKYNEKSIPRRVAFAGNLINQKKVDVIIDALGKLSGVYPDITLAVIGEGPEKERLQKKVRDFGLESSVYFYGRMENKRVISELCKADYFVMPSINEGFGIVYIEAMAASCVAIGTKGEGVDGFIQDGENGFLVRPDNPADIVKVIDYCEKNVSEKNRIRENGFIKASAYTWDKNAERLQMILESTRIKKRKYEHQ